MARPGPERVTDLADGIDEDTQGCPVGQGTDAHRPGRGTGRGGVDGQGDAVDAGLVLLVVDGIAPLPDRPQIAVQILGRAQGLRRPAYESCLGDPCLDSLEGVQLMGQQHLSHAGGMGWIAASDCRRQPYGAGGRIDLGSVDHLTPVEDRVVGGLAEPVGQGFEHGADTHVLGSDLVVSERHAQELVPQHVQPVGVLVGQAGPAQCLERSVHGRLGAGDRPGHLLQPHARRVPGEFLEDREDPVGTHETATVRAFRGFTVRRDCRFVERLRMLHLVPNLRPSYRLLKRAEGGAS